MADVLIYADSWRSPELRHEVPLAIADPFLYVERGGERHVIISSLELPRLEELGGDLVLHTNEEYGWDELVRKGLERWVVDQELTLNACRALGVESAVVPETFPLGIADRLRTEGIELRADQGVFADRRRVKNAFELAGIRRAQRAAEAGMAAARDLLRRADANGSVLLVDGEPLTCERLKAAVEERFQAHGAMAEEFIVSHGAQTAVGHDEGSGPIAPREPVVLDLFPRDRESGCYADMTRTFVVGEPSDEVREYHRLCKEALDRALAQIRAGVLSSDVHRATCEFFEEHGYPTQLSKEPGQVLVDGFYHGLGHGVGLDVHEEPPMGRMGKPLVAGDVVAVEPGLYRRGYGGCRLEDLVLVTADGIENLTDFPYDLAP